jgi:hypothetical protein
MPDRDLNNAAVVSHALSADPPSINGWDMILQLATSFLPWERLTKNIGISMMSGQLPMRYMQSNNGGWTLG